MKVTQARQFAALRKTKQWSRATLKRAELLAPFIEGVAQKESMAWGCLTEVG